MYYPLMINLSNKRITVIGGGKVALRKAKKFLEYDAIVRVISPKILEEFINLKYSYGEKLEIILEEYSDEYINDSYLVVAATSLNNINENIANYCAGNSIFCNVVDSREKSDFIVPSSIKRGDLVISVSTMGKSPSLCSKIRKELEEKYTDEYDEFIELLGKVREVVLSKYSDENTKKEILNKIVEMDLEELRIFFRQISSE